MSRATPDHRSCRGSASQCPVRLLRSSYIDGPVHVCEPFQMLLIQRDHVIRHLPATASNSALRVSVPLWTPDTCANGLDAARPQELEYRAAEFGVPVQYNVPLRTGHGERLSQLLYDPFARRMRRSVEVQNPAPSALDHKHSMGSSFDYREVVYRAQPRSLPRAGWKKD